MGENVYLKWLAQNTGTRWCNDSALRSDYSAAIENGAAGCTTNPPLSFEALTADKDHFSAKIGEIRSRFSGRERVLEYFRLLVSDIAVKFIPLHESSKGNSGYVRSQVEPGLSSNPTAMLEMGKTISGFFKNVMVKIPGTRAGVQVIEELSALGISTTPTVCASVSQLIAMAHAYDRGRERAKKNGLPMPVSTAAFVLGRLQDYLAVLNEERGKPVSTRDLEAAVLGAVKRTYQIFKKEGYSLVIMPAAFRCASQISELSGGAFEMTIHPKYQKMVNEAYANKEIKLEKRIDASWDEDAVNRVLKFFPEFRKAYEIDGMAIEEFDSFGAVTMTLEAFDKTGWQKLLVM